MAVMAAMAVMAVMAVIYVNLYSPMLSLANARIRHKSCEYSITCCYDGNRPNHQFCTCRVGIFRHYSRFDRGLCLRFRLESNESFESFGEE